MVAPNPMFRLALLLLSLILFLLSTCPASACTCRSVTLSDVYFAHDTTWFVRARMLKLRLIREPLTLVPQTRVYTLRIQGVYKGCLRRKRVVLTSPWSGAACGVTLKRGVSYALRLRSGPSPSIFLCDGIRKFSDLGKNERRFLDSRTNCCAGKCRCGANRPPVFCRRRLCVGRKPCAKASKCIGNPCACASEWFGKDGLLACEGFP